MRRGCVGWGKKEPEATGRRCTEVREFLRCRQQSYANEIRVDRQTTGWDVLLHAKGDAGVWRFQPKVRDV